MPLDPAVPPIPGPEGRLLERLARMDSDYGPAARLMPGGASPSVPVVEALPDAGRQGRIVMLQATSTVYIDNGTSWVPLGGITQLAYVQTTSGTTITTASTEGSPLTLLTLPALTFDGSTPIQIECGWPSAEWAASAVGNAYGLNLWNASADLGRLLRYETPGVAGPGRAVPPPYASYSFTPAAGAVTYRIRGYANTNNCTLRAGSGGAGSYLPGWCRVTTSS